MTVADSNEPRKIFGTFPFEFIPQQIEWLRDQRSNSPSRNFTNMAISMLTSMMLEGALEFLLRASIRERSGVGWNEISNDTLENRNLSRLDQDIRRVSGLDGYKKTFHTVFGTSLSQVVNDGEIFEAVGILFKLRGVTVAHGRSQNFLATSFEQFHSPDPKFEWESSVHNEIEKFLEKKGFPTKTPDGLMPEPMNWFADEITDYLFVKSIEFLTELDYSSETDTMTLSYIFRFTEFTRSVISDRLQDRVNPYLPIP